MYNGEGLICRCDGEGKQWCHAKGIEWEAWNRKKCENLGREVRGVVCQWLDEFTELRSYLVRDGEDKGR